MLNKKVITFVFKGEYTGNNSFYFPGKEELITSIVNVLNQRLKLFNATENSEASKHFVKILLFISTDINLGNDFIFNITKKLKNSKSGPSYHIFKIKKYTEFTKESLASSTQSILQQEVVVVDLNMICVDMANPHVED